MIKPAHEVVAGDFIKLKNNGLNGTFYVHVKEREHGGEIGFHVYTKKQPSTRVVFKTNEEVEVVREWPALFGWFEKPSKKARK